MSHVIVLWKWKQENGTHGYDSSHVNTIARMIKRHVKATAIRIVCVTDDPEGITECKTFPLWDDASHLMNASGRHLPSCYRRLRLYCPRTQNEMGIKRGERIVSLDLDTLIIGNLDTLLHTQGRFVGWELRGPYRPRVFNGSLQMFTAGDLAHVWQDFDPERSPFTAADAGFKGSDQAWLSHLLVDKPQSVGLKYPEVSSYPLNNKISGMVDHRTKLIFFHGSAKPWYEKTFAASPWVQRHWQYEAPAKQEQSNVVQTI